MYFNVNVVELFTSWKLRMRIFFLKLGTLTARSKNYFQCCYRNSTFLLDQFYQDDVFENRPKKKKRKPIVRCVTQIRLAAAGTSDWPGSIWAVNLFNRICPDCWSIRISGSAFKMRNCLQECPLNQQWLCWQKGTEGGVGNRASVCFGIEIIGCNFMTAPTDLIDLADLED